LPGPGHCGTRGYSWSFADFSTAALPECGIDERPSIQGSPQGKCNFFESELCEQGTIINAVMASALHIATPEEIRRIQRMQTVTIAWMSVEAVVSLLGYSEPKPTFLGIAILIAAAVMPWLAKEKQRLSAASGSAAVRADAAQSALCAYLSLIALAGLAINDIWRVKWADPIAAPAVLPLIVWEG
jgi:hypothetical protein